MFLVSLVYIVAELSEKIVMYSCFWGCRSDNGGRDVDGFKSRYIADGMTGAQ